MMPQKGTPGGGKEAEGRHGFLHWEDKSVSTLNVPTLVESLEMTVSYDADLYPAAEPAAAGTARLSVTLACAGCQVQTCHSLGCLAPEVVLLTGQAAPSGPAELMPSVSLLPAPPSHGSWALGPMPSCGCCLTGRGEMVSLGQREFLWC